MGAVRMAAASAAVALCAWLAVWAIVPLGAIVIQGDVTLAEGLGRLPNPLSDETIVYYSSGPVPDVEDPGAPARALELALHTWEEYNPGLRFVEHAWSDVRIEWLKHGAVTHSGLATCQAAAVRDRCVLEISIGGTACSGSYVQAEHYLLANLVMHEVGHALGIGHSGEEGHLMYSEADPEFPLDSRGYAIPPRHWDLSDAVKLRAAQVEEARERYDAVYAGYESGGASFAELEEERSGANALIAEYNGMVERLNSISAIMPCPVGQP